MVSMKPKISWKAAILPAIGILAFLAYLYLFNVDVLAIIETAQRINTSIYIFSILFVFIETFFYALSWQSLLSFLSVKLSITKVYLYVWYGAFIDAIVPAASLSGEVSKLYLVTREKSGSGGKVVATLITQRLVGISVIITSLIIGVGIVSAERQITALPFRLALFFAISTALLLVSFVLLCFKESWMRKIIDTPVRLVNYVSRGRWDVTKIKEDAIQAARMFRDSMKEFGRAPKTVFKSTLFVILSWISHLSIAYLVFLALDFHVTWGIILLACSISIVLPARGLPEIAMTTIFTLLGVPPKIAATTTILTRILTFWLRFFLGFLAQQRLEIRARTTSENIPKVEKPYARAYNPLTSNQVCLRRQ